MGTTAQDWIRHTNPKIAAQIASQTGEQLVSEQKKAERRAEKRAKLGPFDSQLEKDRGEFLAGLKLAGEIEDWSLHGIKFRLPGQSNFYTPDFLVHVETALHSGRFWERIRIEEVKGSWASKNARESRTKLKTAAGLNPWATFVAVTRDRSGNWKEEEIRP